MLKNSKYTYIACIKIIVRNCTKSNIQLTLFIMSSFHQQAVKNVCRICSSKIAKCKCKKKCIILPPDSWGGITQEKDLNHR